MILHSKNLFVSFLLLSLFALTPSLGFAQDTPAPNQEKTAEEPAKGLIQRAKEKAAAATEAAKEKAATLKKQAIETAEAATEKAAALTAAAKEKAAAAAEATKEKAAAAAEATKEKAAAVAEAAKKTAASAAESIKSGSKKAAEAASDLVEKAKAKTIGVPAAPEAPAKPAVKVDLKPKVKFSTNMGDFIVELDAEKAPITVKNFMAYVDGGFYTNTLRGGMRQDVVQVIEQLMPQAKQLTK